MMEYNECDLTFKKALPFWNELNSSDKELLCSRSRFEIYKPGDVIHSGMSECTGGILVKSGSIRAYLLSEDGKEVTLYRLFPGDICILSASCVLESITFDVFVCAEENSECYIVDGRALQQVSEHCPKAKIFALETALSRFSDVIWVMQQIMFMSFDKRLAIFLRDEALKNNSDTINLTKEQIAKYTGSAREVVSRMLSYFAGEGIVKTFRGGVKIIEKEKLEQIIKR